MPADTTFQPAPRMLYASDAEDNHEDPWTNGWDPAMCDPLTGAREYADEHGLDVGDHVYVIEASADTDHEYYDDEDRPIPLNVHRTWRFVVTVATDDGVQVEEVANAR